MLRGLLVLTVASASFAQAPAPSGPTGAPTAPPAQAPAPAQPAPDHPTRLEDFPPNIRLGVRVEAIRRGWPNLPILIIVSDEPSYIEAIARWTIQARYPVLLDDGTEAAREDIARFARAYSPKSILRWSSGGTPFSDPAARRAAAERALCRVWTTQVSAPPPAKPPEITTQAQLIALWKDGGILPPGVVVADDADPAWPAALALAVGHAQPILWLHAEGHINGAMPLDAFSTFAEALTSAIDKTGLAWRDLGDAVDSVTLCLNCPAKVQADSQTPLAITDLLTRLKDPTDPNPRSRERAKRWAWCGQVFGTAAQASYRAMCALFLEPRRAWVFDGYPDTKPWSDYDGTAAAATLRKMNLDTVLDDLPHNNERAWRLRADPGVDAGLIMVNTKGAADEFNFEQGRCRPGDVPFVNVPPIVYLVHSFSAAAPGERATVAGRWLERGAYAFLGSVHEPFLTAFMPTPAVAMRLGAGMPWGVAVRYDNDAPPVPAWKIAVFGDPLITLGPNPPAAPGDAPTPDAKDAKDILSEALAAKDFRPAIDTLVILGRDRDAARLAAALLKDDPKSFTPRVAAACIFPCARARDTATLVKAYSQLPADLAADGPRRDALWHACAAEIAGSPPEATVNVLRANLRPDQIGRDAADLSRAVTRFYGREIALGMLSDARARCATDYDRAKVDEAMKFLSGKP